MIPQYKSYVRQCELLLLDPSRQMDPVRQLPLTSTYSQVPDQVFLMGCCATTGLFEGHSNTLWLVVTPVPLRLLALEALRPPHSCFVQVFHKTGSLPLNFEFRAVPVAAGLCGISWLFGSNLLCFKRPVCPPICSTNSNRVHPTSKVD